MESLTGLDTSQLLNTLILYIPKVLAAVIVFFVFWLILKMTRPALERLLEKGGFDAGLIRWLVDNVYRILVLGFGAVMAVNQIGINVGAALAGLGVAGIAIGFAAQDSIANTIAGFLIFWDKPFLVGQHITTQGLYGEVRHITMRTTRIRTLDNTYVVIPNRKIIEDELVNHSLYGETRVRVPVGIAYKEDVKAARKVLLDAVAGREDIMEDPAPDVVVTGLGDSSVDLELRVWTQDPARERALLADLLECAKEALDAADIEIPFPHLQLFVENVEERVWKRALEFPAFSGGKA